MTDRYMNNILFLCVCNSPAVLYQQFPPGLSKHGTKILYSPPYVFFLIYSNISYVMKVPVTGWMFVSSQNLNLEPKPHCDCTRRLGLWEIIIFWWGHMSRVAIMKFNHLMKIIWDSKNSHHCYVMMHWKKMDSLHVKPYMLAAWPWTLHILE